MSDLPFQEKSRALYERFFAGLGPSSDYLRRASLGRLWDVLRREAADLQESGASAPLIRAMRGSSFTFVRDVFDAHSIPTVERVIDPEIQSSLKTVRFMDVLASVPGSSLAIVSSISDKAATSPYLTHLGEKVSLVRKGLLRAEWVPAQSAEGEPRSKLLGPDQPETGLHIASIWMKSRIPHRYVRMARSTQEITFIADPLGPHAIVRSAGLRVHGFGAKTIEPEQTTQSEQMWRRLFSIGPRLAAIKMIKGISAINLSQLAMTHTSNISRLETGERSPDLEEIVRLACALDEPVSELCPTDFDHSVVRGCYAWSDSEIHKYLQNDSWSLSPTLEAQQTSRSILPVRWRDTGLLGTLCSSPSARALVAIHTYLGATEDNSELGQYQTAIGRMNDEFSKGRDGDEWNGFSSSVAEIAILCLEGQVQIEVEPWPESRLYPALASKTSENNRASQVENCTLQTDSLVSIRPLHGFRITRKSKFAHLFVVLVTRRSAPGMVELASPATIEGVRKTIKRALHPRP